MKPGFFKGFNRVLWMVTALAGIYLVIKSYAVLSDNREAVKLDAFLNQLEYRAQTMIIKNILPNIVFPVEAAKEADTAAEYLVKEAYRVMPLYGYVEEYLLFDSEYESMSTYEQILAREAEDENTVDSMTGAVDQSAEDELNLQMEQENAAALHMAEAGQKEESVETAAVPAAGGVSYSIEQLADFDFLLNTFYTVDTSTAVSGEVLDAGRLLEKDMTLDPAAEGPQILIYHTHSQEGFVDSEPGNLDTTIVGVGDYLAQLLEQNYGYRVIHNREIFDMVNGKEDRNKAFTLAGERISQVLAENPSIQVVIDLHRDGVKEGVRLVTNVDGKDTAQFMFFNGLSYSKKNGEITYLPNPYIEDNLALTLQMQLKAAQYYPGVTRKIYLKTYRYNLHLSPKAMLVECGAQTNTLQEMKNAMEPLASILHMVLSGE